MSDQIKHLRQQISQCLRVDQHRFLKRVEAVHLRLKQGKPVDQILSKLEAEISISIAAVEHRQLNLPIPEYPLELPVCEKREQIKEAIVAHQVVIVAGETGSGKTTQLPKICLELGRGVTGMIGHTQPRRLAARTLAARIASELKSEVGHSVGYKVRFSDRISSDSYIKVMTDGIMLAELQSDHWLNGYDTIIIDEAHERSLNIDFILGYLKQLLPKRPDLKLIITSATIDTERFSKHFDDAPVVEVSGRTYPVEVRYRPLAEEEGDTDMVDGILNAVDELSRLDRFGHVLVFLPGEREIREVSEALRKHHPVNTEILPLYARLSAAEQSRIFQSSQRQRIVLSTNVAETSLTVPGIRYVVDPGVARISRYSYRSKVQRLPIEAVSQASANQRMGRCGRVAPGVCIRLYSEEDFNGRPEFTEPEIHRTNLASVILKMQSLGLGNVQAFPFVDPPDSRMINDGYGLLQEIGALDRQKKLTDIGRKLANLPIDPRIGRMVLTSVDEGALAEVLVIAAALSVQEPRERPAEHQQAADEKHRLFADEHSDFLSYLNLWRWFREQKRHLTRNKLRKLCKQHFVSYLRMLEWEDIYQQLHSQTSVMGLHLNQEGAGYDQVHRSLLSGLLGNIGFKLEDKEYLGARNKKLRIFPGSGLYKKQPKWMMAAEIVETSQLFARTVAKIEPEWVEQIAADLCKRNYSEPHWEKRRAQVVAYLKLTLYGLPIIARRKVHYGPIDPKLSRDIFIRDALVAGEFNTRLEFYVHNRSLITEIETLEDKARRRDILVDEQQIYEFYDQFIPENVFNGIKFDRWYKQAVKKDSKLLFLTKEQLLSRDDQLDREDFPDFFDYQGIQLPLEYQFDPSHQADGVSVIVPITLLNQLEASRFDWLVPGFLKEKLIYLIKALPKSLRRRFVPAPDYAQACIDSIDTTDGRLLFDELGRQLNRLSGEPLPSGCWDAIELPIHLSMNFIVQDAEGEKIAQGRDLYQLQQQYGTLAESSFVAISDSEWEREELTDWDFDAIPEVVEIEREGMVLRGYPAIVDAESSISLKLLDSRQKAVEESHRGIRRLFMLQIPDKIKYVKKSLTANTKLNLYYASIGKVTQLYDDVVITVVEQAFFADDIEITSRESYQGQLEDGKQQFISVANRVEVLLEEILRLHHDVQRIIKGKVPAFWLNALADIKNQLSMLVFPGFVAEIPLHNLEDYSRYLKAIKSRLEKLNHSLERDKQSMVQVNKVWKQYQRGVEKDKKHHRHVKELNKIRWMIEELRISLFAQEIKTKMPVSVQRIEKIFSKMAL